MKHTLIVYSSNRNLNHDFNDSLRQSIASGSAVIEQLGVPDVSLARNFALTKAAQALRSSHHDVVMMVDDDIVWTQAEADQLVKYVGETKVPASGAYMLRDGKVAAHYRGPRWNTGLGFLAIHREQLLALADACEPFEFGGRTWLEFTRSGVVIRDGKRHWLTEDYFFTDRLGGVQLLPIAVSHMKITALRPSVEHLPDFIAKTETKKP